MIFALLDQTTARRILSVSIAFMDLIVPVFLGFTTKVARVVVSQLCANSLGNCSCKRLASEMHGTVSPINDKYQLKSWLKMVVIKLSDHLLPFLCCVFM